MATEKLEDRTERTLEDAKRIIRADFERRLKAAKRVQRWRDNHKGEVK
jgi:hypothetical protein